MTTLQDLLRQAKTDRKVRSGRALADMAASHGYKIDRTQVNGILGGTYKSKPGRPLLEAVAWLAQCELEDVYEAANLPLPGPSFADELPPDADYLRPHERHAVITVIRAFLGSAEEEGGGGRADNPAPNMGAGGPGALLDINEGAKARRERLRRDALPGETAAYEGDANKGDND